jgi:hypothetical protein
MYCSGSGPCGSRQRSISELSVMLCTAKTQHSLPMDIGVRLIVNDDPE